MVKRVYGSMWRDKEPSVCRYFISEGRGIEKYNDPLMAGGVMNGRAVTFSNSTTKVISLSLSEVFCGFAPAACFF